MTTVVLRTIARILTPFIQLFGLYIIAHGPVSPGGGFQGGMIVGASFILLALSFGPAAAEARLSHRLRIIMDSGGSLFFAGAGLAALLVGGTFLQYGVIPLPVEMTPAETSGLMILLIGAAIGVHIMALAASLFLHFAED